MKLFKYLLFIDIEQGGSKGGITGEFTSSALVIYSFVFALDIAQDDFKNADNLSLVRGVLRFPLLYYEF